MSIIITLATRGLAKATSTAQSIGFTCREIEEEEKSRQDEAFQAWKQAKSAKAAKKSKKARQLEKLIGSLLD